MNVLGLDIGGVNTKAAVVELEPKTNDFKILEVKSRYLPFWLEKEKLRDLLQEIKSDISDLSIDAIGVTMTAELSDCFRTKSEGVTWIVHQVDSIFPDANYINITGNIQNVNEILECPGQFAASNWLAIAMFIGKIIPTCIMLDIGSTTTDIIPIQNGIPNSVGRTDLDRLCSGELVYTGVLRTNVACITSKIPIKDKVATVASELFSTSGDLHLILENIQPSEFTCETADGRPATIQYAMERLARVICADLDTLSIDEVHNMASYIYQKQLKQVECGVSQVFKRFSTHCPIVVTGLGAKFLAAPAAINQGFNNITNLSNIMSVNASIASTAVATAAIVGWKLLTSDHDR